MTAAGPAEPVEVDARGLRCPLPVIRLAAAARDLPAGTEPGGARDRPRGGRRRPGLVPHARARVPRRRRRAPCRAARCADTMSR
nr:hypothetical protein [Angustibacter aerolatus]